MSKDVQTATDSNTLTRCPNGHWNRALAGEPVMRGSYCLECGERIADDAEEVRGE